MSDTDHPYQLDANGHYVMPNLDVKYDQRAHDRRAAERSRAALAASAEGQRKVEAAAAGREKERLAHAAAQLEAFQENARRRWIDNGGSEAGFARQWPTIRDAHLTRKVAGPSSVAEDVERLRANPLYQV